LRAQYYRWFDESLVGGPEQLSIALSLQSLLEFDPSTVYLLEAARGTGQAAAQGVFKVATSGVRGVFGEVVLTLPAS
jgi:tRNA(Met) C34 N-acetyltransferase TmcA